MNANEAPMSVTKFARQEESEVINDDEIMEDLASMGHATASESTPKAKTEKGKTSTRSPSRKSTQSTETKDQNLAKQLDELPALRLDSVLKQSSACQKIIKRKKKTKSTMGSLNLARLVVDDSLKTEEAKKAMWNMCQPKVVSSFTAEDALQLFNVLYSSDQLANID